ncbi:MAG: hypothetical protein ABI858_04100 [Pseudoxanthomonas sp.]
MNVVLAAAAANGVEESTELAPQHDSYFLRNSGRVNVATKEQRTLLASIPVNESAVLRALYDGTGGPNWIRRNGWLASRNECEWEGISCDSQGSHVVRINLIANNLRGSLPWDLFSNLTKLQRLTVSGNSIGGQLPTFAGSQALLEVDVANNQFTGSIPSFAGLTQLQFFSAYSNQLSGSIPSLTGVANLAALDLSENKLTGPIPSLTGLTSLEGLEIDDNQLTGSIPSLNGLTSLQFFYAQLNQLTGAIPSLAGLSSLRFFRVGFNRINGLVPAVPGSGTLVSGASNLCPNPFDTTQSPNDFAWDAATGISPWWGEHGGRCDILYEGSFE